MARRLHPNFEQDNQWLQSFDGVEPTAFMEMLSILRRLEGEFVAHAVSDALSFRLAHTVSGAVFELFRQSEAEILKASWLAPTIGTEQLDAIRQRLEKLHEELRVFSRQSEYDALDRFMAEKSEITVYPPDHDFFMAMPEPRAFFEAAELREDRVVVDTRSSLILEWGANYLVKAEGWKRPMKVATAKVIQAGREATGW